MSYKLLNTESTPFASLPDKEEQEILKRADQMIGESAEAKRDIKQIMEHSYLSFRSIASDFTYKQRDIERYGLAIYVPITFQVIASIAAQLNGRPPMYHLGPMNSPSDRDTAKFMEKISHNEFKRAQIGREITTGIQTSLIHGTAFLRDHLKYDKRKAKFITSTKEDGTPIYEEQNKTFYYGHAVTNDHPLKVYLPPVHESDPQKWPYYIVRELTPVQKIKDYYEMHPELAYKKNYKGLVAGGSLIDDMECYFRIDPVYKFPDIRYPGNIGDLYTQSNQKGKTYASLDKEKLCETFRIFSMENDEWMFIANGRVMEFHPNPIDSKILPVTVMRDYKVEFSPWGMGEPQLLRYIQMEANALHTFAMDGTKFATNGVFAINPNGLKNPNDLSVYPGKIFTLKNMPGLTIESVIQSLNSPDVKSSVFKMLGINSQLQATVSGTGSSVIGGDPINPSQSATESNNLKAAATTRVYERARMIEQENVCDIVRHQIDFMANFYNQEMVFKVTDNEFYKFVPGDQSQYPVEKMAADVEAGFSKVLFSEDLSKGYDVTIEGESTLPISQSEKRMEAMQLLKIAAETRRPVTSEELAKDPTLAQTYPQGVPVFDTVPIAKELVLPTYSIVDSADEFMWKPGAVNAPDRMREPGRPDDPFSQDDMAANAAGAPNGPNGQIMADAQPVNEGVNAQERML